MIGPDLGFHCPVDLHLYLYLPWLGLTLNRYLTRIGRPLL